MDPQILAAISQVIDAKLGDFEKRFEGRIVEMLKPDFAKIDNSIADMEGKLSELTDSRGHERVI